jgi:hypothetical protein
MHKTERMREKLASDDKGVSLVNVELVQEFTFAEIIKQWVFFKLV